MNKLRKVLLLFAAFITAIGSSVVLHEYAHRSICRMYGVEGVITWVIPPYVICHLNGADISTAFPDAMLHVFTYAVMSIIVALFLLRLLKVLFTKEHSC